MSHSHRHRALTPAILALAAALASPAHAADDPSPDNPIRNSDDILVTATRVNKETPITASVHTFEPQAIVSRSIIENSIAPTADYSQVIMLTPGASLAPSSGNGIGLGDVKVTLRGFKDGQYNITYDGVPFGDSNDPTHHSTAYFPNGTYERIIVDRGPGSATDLGQESYGGNVHLISRELADHFFTEGQAVYGSFDTHLERLTVNSGKLDSLGGLKIIAVGEFKGTQGALTNQSGTFVNGFVKLEMPIGSDAKFSILSNYNQSLYHQSDAAGGATAAQIAAFGKDFGAIDPAHAAGSGYTDARNDWNWQNKTTDMEIARLQWNIGDRLSIDNKAYTYFYKNFTVTTDDATTPCNVLSSANQCIGAGYANALLQGTGPGGAQLNAAQKTANTVVGDIPGHTKINQYRTSGDILQIDYRTDIGTAKVGAWYEHSVSHRYRYDYDFTKAAAGGALSDYNFNIAAMRAYYNYDRKNGATNLMLNGQPVPAYINYDEHTGWDQIQGFGEFEFKLFDDRLTLTPGVKVQSFTRRINTPIAAQSTRLGIKADQTYRPTLPYATANFLIRPDLSVYFQYAKGFIIPSLSASLETSGKTNAVVPLNPMPTKTTNYQIGAVYAGERLNIDVDGYYIQASNSTTIDPTNSNNITVNANPAVYKGLEGQVSYLVANRLTLIANGTIMSSKDDVTKLWLPNAPDYTALLGVVYNSGSWKFSYLHKFTGRQWVDSANTTRMKAYSYGVLAASYSMGSLTVGVTVNNLLNDRPIVAQSGATTDPTTLYIFQAERSYLGSIKYRF